MNRLILLLALTLSACAEPTSPSQPAPENDCLTDSECEGLVPGPCSYDEQGRLVCVDSWEG